jgi:sulfite reductase (NADPH) hemoprotein beta-component
MSAERARLETAPGRVGFADQADVDLFVGTLERYERGEIDADAWRAFRLTNGVYGQRQVGVQMLRVKLPMGVCTAAQLRAVRGVAARYGNRAHVTTRQNFQFYGLPLPEVEGVLRELAAVGITSKEACGHAVRNVCAEPLAGVDPAEVFDVTPYAEGLVKHFLRGKRSSSLPRKFKIAFEGSPRGDARAEINDLAYLAQLGPDGERRFRVLVGGGTSTLPRAAAIIADQLPAAEILGLGEAVLRVFHRDGERANKAKARSKWLIKKIGWDEFKRRVLAMWDEVKAEGSPRFDFDPQLPPALTLPVHEAELATPGPGYAAWSRTNVFPQKQPGHAAATVTLRLGDLDPRQLGALADLAERFSDGTVRTTIEQNLVLRHVRVESLPALHAELLAIGLGAPGAATFADVTSCAGADTCSIAVTASRGMGALLTDALADSAAARGEDPDTRGAQIKVSGCPNGCGQHHIASVGLQGAMRKVGGKALPLYQISIGGGPGRFGRWVGKVPARRAPAAVERILQRWREERSEGEQLDAWLARIHVDVIKQAIGELFDIDEHSATAEDFVDLGQDAPFEVMEGEAECAQ